MVKYLNWFLYQYIPIAIADSPRTIQALWQKPIPIVTKITLLTDICIAKYCITLNTLMLKANEWRRLPSKIWCSFYFVALIFTVELQARHCLRTMFVPWNSYTANEVCSARFSWKGRMSFEEPYLYEGVTCLSHNKGKYFTVEGFTTVSRTMKR